MSQSFDDHEKAFWDSIASTLSAWSELQKDAAYLQMYRSGTRIEGLDYKIEKALRAQWKAGQ